jgi:hypothetical protein
MELIPSFLGDRTLDDPDSHAHSILRCDGYDIELGSDFDERPVYLLSGPDFAVFAMIVCASWDIDDDDFLCKTWLIVSAMRLKRLECREFHSQHGPQP